MAFDDLSLFRMQHARYWQSSIHENKTRMISALKILIVMVVLMAIVSLFAWFMAELISQLAQTVDYQAGPHYPGCPVECQ
jgi:hypothetical protein